MPARPNSAVPSPAILALYNAVPSVFWSVLSLGPLSVFCYQHLARPWLYGFLVGSGLLYLVPRSWFRGWQLSARPAVYERLGVLLVNRFAQHGRLVNGLLRRRYPQYRRLHGRPALRTLVGQSYHMERFHAAALVFFLLSALQAAAQGRWGWAALLTGLNVGYNLYPIWLQQYLRLRLGAAPTLPPCVSPLTAKIRQLPGLGLCRRCYNPFPGGHYRRLALRRLPPSLLSRAPAPGCPGNGQA